MVTKNVLLLPSSLLSFRPFFSCSFVNWTRHAPQNLQPSLHNVWKAARLPFHVQPCWWRQSPFPIDLETSTPRPTKNETANAINAINAPPPAWEMVSFSLAMDSGRAFSNWGSTPASRKRLTMASLILTLAVPMRMGRPLRSLFSTISWRRKQGWSVTATPPHQCTSNILEQQCPKIVAGKVYVMMID